MTERPTINETTPLASSCDDAEPALQAREILMIEDSATDAELALRALQRAEFANPVRVVASGELGLDYLFGVGIYAQRAPAQPQLILLDLNLPEMSGIDFLRRIKADERTRGIQVIVLTLSDRDRDVAACVQLGAEAYIIKPLNFENFVRVTTRLKLRLTLVAGPDARKLGGWILSGFSAGTASVVAEMRRMVPPSRYSLSGPPF